MTKEIKDFPKRDVGLNISNPKIVQSVINILLNNSVPVHEDSHIFDKNYPYLYWDEDCNVISQRKDVDDISSVNTVEEFLSLFINNGIIEVW